MTEEALFELALHTPEAERAGLWLAHPDLRERVLALLAAHEGMPNSRPDGATVTAVVDSEQTGTYRTASARAEAAAANVVVGGKYRLVEVIGEGGMGSVWRAQQTAPVQRAVALKLIKAGMDTKSVLARFEAERQALALMDHPNIAKVLDGGVHEGRPYFVMELVKGVPITEYCDHNKLTPPQRLELFVQVCQAIQHAHQKGIIHRDIKPSNVLIALYDDKPVVKVIDFGVAKATGGTLSEHTIDTGLGGVVGTPQYMSPEQATFNNLDIDTRSDVYALGVLLYELLTGTPPFSGAELKQKGLLEILRVVREDEPPRPSTKLSTADALPSISANRGTEPKKLTGLLRNELDWIVMKALEKDRGRRYETANGFAADVLRYLCGEAVQAHPPSRPYRLKKFVRRHRRKVLATGMVLATLVVGIVGTTMGLLVAKEQAARARDEADKKEVALELERHARAEAEDAREAEATAKVLAESKRKEAEASLAHVKKGNEILNSIFNGLSPRAEYRSTAELRSAMSKALKLAIRELEGSAVGDPKEVAFLQANLGASLLHLGETKLAIEILSKAYDTQLTLLGPDHYSTLRTMNKLAECYIIMGQSEKALSYYEKAYKHSKNLDGSDEVVSSVKFNILNGLASALHHGGKITEALPLYEESLKLTKAKFGLNHDSTITAMNNLASGYEAADQRARALPLYEETLRLTELNDGPKHPNTFVAMSNLANFLAKDREKIPDALKLLEQAWNIAKESLGPNHIDTITAAGNLAHTYFLAGMLEKAVPLFEDSLRLMQANLGQEHPKTIRTMEKLAACYKAARKWDLALPLYEESYRLLKTVQGPNHQETISSMVGLAMGYEAAGRIEKALPLYEEAYPQLKAKLGPTHRETLAGMYSRANIYRVVGQLDKAIPLLEETYELMQKTLGPDHPNTLITLSSLALAHKAAGQFEQALPLLQKTLEIRIAKFGPEHPETITSKNNLANGYIAIGKVAEALPLCEEAAAGVAKRKFQHPHAGLIIPNTIVAYLDAGKHDRADAWLQQWLGYIEQECQGKTPKYANELAFWGLTFLERKHWPQAEPILKESLAIREKTQPEAWTTFNTMSLLGGALLGQKKYTDAEPLLLKGYEGMKAREAKIPPQGATRIPQALDRLLELYTATNKPDEVKKYQELRAKYPAAIKG